MSEMKPLLDDPVSPDAARLLRSAAKDGPKSTELAEARTLAAISVISSAEVATSSTSGGRLLGSFTRAGTLCALAAVVVFGSVIAIRSSAPAPLPTPHSTPTTTEIATQPSPATLPIEGVRVDELPSAAVPDIAGKVAGPRPSKPQSRPGLEDELAAIDIARGALASGHPDVALARVHDYQRKFREGRFTEEAEALEVQSLAALGRRAEARENGERFLASHPGSPYERRVRSALGSKDVKP